MLYVVCTMLRKALELYSATRGEGSGGKRAGGAFSVGWKDVMLMPHDFDKSALYHPLTRALMEKMSFEHGGRAYDEKYPDGIPTSIAITDDQGQTADSGLVMYPAGHARNKTADLHDILGHKFRLLGRLAFERPEPIIEKIERLPRLSADELQGLYDFEIADRGRFE